MGHGKPKAKTAVSFGFISFGQLGSDYRHDADITGSGLFSGLEVVPIRFARH
jgi:hypothetical protein